MTASLIPNINGLNKEKVGFDLEVTVLCKRSDLFRLLLILILVQSGISYSSTLAAASLMLIEVPLPQYPLFFWLFDTVITNVFRINQVLNGKKFKIYKDFRINLYLPVTENLWPSRCVSLSSQLIGGVKRG